MRIFLFLAINRSGSRKWLMLKALSVDVCRSLKKDFAQENLVFMMAIGKNEDNSQ